MMDFDFSKVVGLGKATYMYKSFILPRTFILNNKF